MANMLQTAKTVYSTEEFNELTEMIRNKGGRVIGIFTCGKGSCINYQIPADKK